MPTHATMRGEYVEMRLMGWVTDGARNLTGVPSSSILHTDVPRVDKVLAPPYIKCTFRPQRDRWAGKYDDTYDGWSMTTVMVLDLHWPTGEHGEAFNQYDPQRPASELRDQLQGLKLTFLDYGDPGNPTVVDGTYLRIHKPVVTERLGQRGNHRRWQVRAQIEWVGRTART